MPVLEQAGHRTHALTLPGMESKDADRSEITLRDHVDAVVDVIDSLDPVEGKVVLVPSPCHAGVRRRFWRSVDAIRVSFEPS